MELRYSLSSEQHSPFDLGPAAEAEHAGSSFGRISDHPTGRCYEGRTAGGRFFLGVGSAPIRVFPLRRVANSL
jgi:hypothetical protein